MTITYLKRGKPEADRVEDDAKTAAVVAATLKDIEARGDTAVRELANKFDSYDRSSYRLTHSEIDTLISKVSPDDLEDIKFAQYPSSISWLLCPGWQIPDGCIGAYVYSYG
jgi:sulfopropanediol 3-dehydrogenase